MYQQGELVVYGSHGVCCVTGVEERKVDRKIVEYLVLSVYGQSGSNFLVPLHNANAMSKLYRVLSKEEWESLLNQPQLFQGAWIPEENKRKLCYRELLCGGDRTGLMQMVCTLRKHRQSQLEAGRKLHQCDEMFLRDAQKRLSIEYSVALGITASQAEKDLCDILDTYENA